MSARSITPDFTSLQIPWDQWSEPFWQGTATHELRMPRCADCGTYRWPAGPFCFQCQSQKVEWRSPGQARLFSFTVLHMKNEEDETSPLCRIPALVEFAEAKGVRLVSVLVDAPADEVEIGAPIAIDWLPAANATVPVFRLTS